MAKTAPVFLLAPPFVEGALVRLPDGERRHARARRLRAGSPVRIAAPSGESADGVVERIDRGACEIRILRAARAEAPETTGIVLFVPAIRLPRLSWLVEKATELGAAEVRVVESARTQGGRVESVRTSIERLRRVATEAGKQSGARPPSIGGPVAFDDALAASSGHASSFQLDPGVAPFPDVVAAPAALWVGPEGGWSAAEREAALRAGWTRVSLPGAILRAETAAIAALVLALRSLTPPTARADNTGTR